MRTLPARTDLLKDRSYAAPIYLLKGELTAPGALTLYLGDGALAAVNHVAAGQEWLPIVLEWGDVESALETSSAGGAPGTLDVTLSNAMPVGGKSRLSDLIRSNLNTTGAYVFTGSKWTLYEILETGAAAADLVILGVFYVDGTPAMGSRTVRLRFIDPSGYIDRRQAITKVDTTNFPTADPDDVGKAIPRVFGSSVVNVGAIAAKAGGLTFLTAAMPLGGSVISVYDASRFASSGSCQIGVDTYTYSKVSATSLRVVPKASPGPHPAGTFVIDITTSFVYVVAENIGTGAGVGAHKHSAVSNVRSEKIPQSPTVNLDDTTLVSGKSFVTLTFTVPPGTVIQKATDTASLPTSPQTIITKYVPTNLGVNSKIKLAMTAISSTKTGTFTITVTQPVIVGTVQAVRRRLRFRVVEAPATVTAWEIRRDSATGPVLTSGTRLVVGETQPFSFGTGTVKGSQVVFFKVTGLTGNATLHIIEFDEEIESTILAPSPGLTIADIIVGNVRCDVTGLKDDSAGTITGTPGTLLELPADIARCIMVSLFGIAAADLGATWATTRTLQSLTPLKWAFVLGEERFSDLRTRLGDQGRAVMFWDSGLCHYKYLSLVPAADITLAYATDIIDADDAAVNQTEATKVVNHLNAYWERDYGKSGSLGDSYRSMQVFEDLTQVGFTDSVPEDLELDLIRDSTTAGVIASVLLERRKRQRFEYNAVAVWNVLAIESVGYVAISGHPVLTAHGDTALTFEVRRKRAMPSAANPGRVQLGLLEANA